MIPLPFTLLFGVRIYTPFLCFLFSICWRAGLVVQNSLSFCLSEKLLISHSYLNEILAGYNNLGCRLFSFIILSMSCHSLLAWRVSIERSAVILMAIPLCVICCFSLAAFHICSLCLIFVNVINMCLGGFRLGFILFGVRYSSPQLLLSCCLFLLLCLFSLYIFRCSDVGSINIYDWFIFLMYWFLYH